LFSLASHEIKHWNQEELPYFVLVLSKQGLRESGMKSKFRPVAANNY
jgi:hypothetical protein